MKSSVVTSYECIKQFIPDVMNYNYLLIIMNNHTRRFFIHKLSTSSWLPERAPNLTSVRPMYLGKRELPSYLICSLHNYILLELSPSWARERRPSASTQRPDEAVGEN